MENLNSYLSGWRKKSNRRMRSFYRGPESDWQTIFVVAMVAVLLIAILSILILFKIDKGEIFVTDRIDKEERESLDLNKLKETVSYYQNKALELQKIKNQRHSTPDPSL